MSKDNTHNSLMGHVVDAQNRFCANMTKRFNLMQGRMLNEKGVCIKKSIFEELGGAFAEDLRQRVLLPHTKILLQVRSKFAEKTDSPEEIVAYITRKTENLGESIRLLFRRSMSQQSDFYNQSIISAKEIDRASEEFSAQVKKIVDKYNETILCLLGLGNVAQVQCSCSLLEEPEAPSDYIVQDVFGRIILNPLDEYYSVEDVSTEVDLQRLVFPRSFCAATLKIIRTYVIGVEKYELLNTGLLSSIQRLCGKEKINREDCRNYLGGPDLERYLTSYCLHILSALLDEERRESFSQRIDIELNQSRPDLGYSFTDKHLNMLLDSWANYVFDKVEDLNKRKRTKNILRNFIPDHVDRLEARSRYLSA